MNDAAANDTSRDAGPWETIVTGIDFGEGPRWHDGRLWFSDFFQRTISSVGADGERRVEVDDLVRPSGLDWLPDGRLLFVSMSDRRLMRREADGTIVVHAELGELANGHCNDMVVDADGRAYVGNFGFDFEGGAEPQSTGLIIVEPDGTARLHDHQLMFPNGSVLVDDTLIVGESFGAQYTAFDVGADGDLSNPRIWASVDGMAPDGCTMDAEGAIWFSDALGSRVVRVIGGDGGADVVATIPTPDPTFACMLGGDDGTTLYALTSEGTHPDQCTGTGTGKLIATTVDVPRHPTARP